ncbi:MAG: tetratricopeptide repeat protein [Planctomycetota bacterium]
MHSLRRLSGGANVLLCVSAMMACSPAFSSQEPATSTHSGFSRFQEFVTAGEYSSAERMLAEDPELAHDDVLMMPWLKLKQGKTEEGISLLRRHFGSATQRRDQVAADTLQVVADVSIESAIELGNGWLRDPDVADIHPQLRWLLSRLNLRNNRPEVARALVEEGLKNDYTGDFLRDGVFAYVLYLYQAGEPVEALRYFDALKERVPETRLEPSYQLQWAHIASAAGQPLGALKTLDRLQSEHPDYYKSNEVLFHVSKGLAYIKVGSVVDAKIEFSAAIECSRSDPSQADIAKAKLLEISENEESQRLAAMANASAADAFQTPLTNQRSWASRVLLLVNGVAVAVLFLWWMARKVLLGRASRTRE